VCGGCYIRRCVLWIDIMGLFVCRWGGCQLQRHRDMLYSGLCANLCSDLCSDRFSVHCSCSYVKLLSRYLHSRDLPITGMWDVCSDYYYC
jgi:hypothetical protein